MSELITKILLFVACPVTVVSGVMALTDYSYRVGERGDVAQHLSLVDFDAPLREQRTSLFMFYHPHCPCTVSTIRNLERLATIVQDRADIFAIAYCPNGEADGWIESSSTKHIRRISDASVVIDRDARICQRFGVQTSGHVLLYDSKGRLQFSGGITTSRGHEGDCLASTELLDQMKGSAVTKTDWPVFGCPLISTREFQE